MTLAHYLSFVAAASILAIIPGPGVLFVLAQTSKGGKSAGFSGSVGTAIGGLFHVFAAAIGLSALVYSSAVAFQVVKLIGALYLFLLGWRALRQKQALTIDALAEVRFEKESLKQGIVTEAFNPRTALFLLALIPQFIDPTAHIALQFVVLGTTSVFLNTTVDILVVLSSDALISYLRRSQIAANSFKYASAAGYFGLGLLSLRTSRNAIL